VTVIRPATILLTDSCIELVTWIYPVWTVNLSRNPLESVVRKPMEFRSCQVEESLDDTERDPLGEFKRIDDVPS
jgi:hypothetical protein